MTTRKRRADDSEEDKKSRRRSVEKEDSGFEIDSHDRLFDLYDDCLLDILTRLDHNDLDEVSTLSKKMHTMSEKSRSKVGKFVATTLELEQVNHRRISLTMKYEEKYYVTLIRGNAPLELLKVMTTHPGRSNMRFYDAIQTSEHGELSEAISTQISTCLNRFAFQRIDFISVISTSLANSFTVFRYRFHCVKCFEQLTQISPECMIFRKCVTPNLSIDGKERFKSMLITAKAPRLRMNFNNDVSFLDAAFLTAYSDAVPLADISIYGENTPLIYPDSSFAETLAKFGDFTWCCMVVNTEWILASIQKRLRSKVAGDWTFAITRNIESSDVTDVLESDLKYTQNNNQGHTIFIPDTHHKASIRTRFSAYDAALLLVDVSFYNE